MSGRSILVIGVGATSEPRRASTTSTAPVLVGALGSVGEDLRRHDTCAPTAMAGQRLARQ